MNIERLNFLSGILDKSNIIQKLNDQEKESNKLAYTLLEINESADEIRKHINLLLNDRIENDEINDIIWDIGEELYHILYHLKNNKFYSYILDRLE